jgi:hypothetical protein
VRPAAVIWGLLAPLVHAVVARHLRNPQAVVLEDSGPAFALRGAVSRVCAPRADSILVAPEGQLQHFLRIRYALKALHRYEAIDFFELGPQGRCQVEVCLTLPFGRLDFKNNRYHWAVSSHGWHPSRASALHNSPLCKGLPIG